MSNYKEAQQKARDAARKAKHGKEVVCKFCKKGSAAGQLIRTNSRFVHFKTVEGEYAHAKCN